MIEEPEAEDSLELLPRGLREEVKPEAKGIRNF